MSTRNIWADVYGVGHTVTSISTAANCAKGIALKNHPSFSAGTSIIDQRKAIGVSYRRGDTGFEYQQGASVPEASWEFDASYKNLSRILWSLFQQGSFQGEGTVYPKYFVPYDTSELEVWLNLIRKLAPSGTATSQRVKGAVCHSLALSGEEGQTISAVAEFRGYGLETNHDIASDTLTFDAVAPLMFQNATITLDGNTVYIPNFNLTITNNLVTKFYDNATAVRHILNDFTAEGTIVIPWADENEGGNSQFDDFVAGNVSRLVIRWGDNEIASADGNFSMIMNIRRTNATHTGDVEVVTEIPFHIVSGLESGSVKTTSASTIKLNGNASVTGTNTEFDSFEVGDLLYALNAAAAGDRTVRVITAIASDTAITVYPTYSGSDTGLLYKVMETPLTISLGDSQNISGM